MSGSGGHEQSDHPPDEVVEIPGAHGGGHGGGDDHGEGNWLVSYADMMTLLVGFFVIMLSFSKVDDEKFEQVKQIMTQKFGGNYEIPYSDLSQKIKERIEQLGQGNQVVIKTTEAGVEISFHGTVFFNLGSADVKPEAETLLHNIIPVIKAETTDFEIIVEGHTDDIPISSSILFRNNWELSSIRACRVLNYFIEGGFKLPQLTAVGFGEARPIKPNRDSSGKAISENQSQNRRVIIKLVKKAEPPLGPTSS